ncbi:MAG: xanthine dehydrogenase family protein subunit M [Rhodobacteraceae bacterium]|nr:xanthine dehydrogenase family protein subunit M [Paracoccaceae bacterium]
MQFHRPETVEAALHLLSEQPAKLLAGGTDFFPALGGKTTLEPVIDLSRIKGLKGIAKSGETWRIGAMTTWSKIRDADLPGQFHALQLAAAEVGSIQIQNSGTIAGNICNASPAADGVPPLLALKAEVEIAGPEGMRIVPISEFVLGVRRTALQPGEFVTALLIPDQPAGQSSFLKLGARRYLVISIAMVAANVVVSPDDTIDDVSIAVGACSAVAQRLSVTEKALIGQIPGSESFKAAFASAEMPELAPIDDVRASADYRLDAVRTLVERAVMLAAAGKE